MQFALFNTPFPFDEFRVRATQDAMDEPKISLRYGLTPYSG
jgi:hypothetical protein